MKFNIACPETGKQKMIEIDDERRLRAVYDKRIAQEVVGDELGDEFKGYIFRISGGNDKQGFPMKQGVLTTKRVRLLLNKDVSCYRPRKKGERKRKSVRGCIVAADISILNLVIVKIGEQEVAGLTDGEPVPNRLVPKRANNIRKLFGLTKEDDVTKYVIRREFTTKTGKTKSKAPKIQRLITPARIQRKKRAFALKLKQQEKVRKEEQAYQKLYQQRVAEAKERRASEASKRRSRLSKDGKN
mmetsp:Transcript_2433/g.5584  ORF Transcript_2433/g.5584 Transcript_2433/m.5584 type:complete len:243 (+) Transcript_2433:49-777(+)|eukprot:CAMPEP_0171495608 /NCGR_PEP_ID=MMETSP0958-20121227/6236_1 /TAXON_ID=87120 /ORGANISM="Aurantiochytrium limacinum, Strain ATCCMYA-1381" /LENGTH=242 /DNA_ID=CAMNT_0012029609 /DNA_START=408 /DNA_END=1136 /DNA_ORIENTATION=-